MELSPIDRRKEADDVAATMTMNDAIGKVFDDKKKELVKLARKRGFSGLVLYIEKITRYAHPGGDAKVENAMSAFNHVNKAVRAHPPSIGPNGDNFLAGRSRSSTTAGKTSRKEEDYWRSWKWATQNEIADLLKPHFPLTYGLVKGPDGVYSVLEPSDADGTHRAVDEHGTLVDCGTMCSTCGHFAYHHADINGDDAKPLFLLGHRVVNPNGYSYGQVEVLGPEESICIGCTYKTINEKQLAGPGPFPYKNLEEYKCHLGHLTPSTGLNRNDVAASILFYFVAYGYEPVNKEKFALFCGALQKGNMIEWLDAPGNTLPTF